MHPTTAPLRDLPQASASRDAVLRVVQSPDPGRVGIALRLDQGPLLFGRGVPNGVADGRLSREHCRITSVSGAIRIEDLGSSNGTFVRGEKIERDYLSSGSVVRIGDTLMVLDEEPAADAFPAAATAGGAAPGFVGSSFTAIAIRRWIATAGPAGASVFIHGLTGAGKEVVAHALHDASGRRGPFVAVNATTLTAALADAQLFGHRKGAFTGAAESHDGFFVEAHGGTLFLDEIGDLPPEVQVKLLRTLEDGIVRPVGSATTRTVDVRVVAATNADLAARGFRTDLLTRLSAWSVKLPALCDRRADILDLARYFQRQILGTQTPPEWTAEAAEALLLWHWPGNVRELRDLIRRCQTLADTEAWDLDLLPGAMQQPVRQRAGSAKGDMPDRTTLEEALRQAKGNVAEVAERFSRDRTQVYRWLKRLRLDPDSYR